MDIDYEVSRIPPDNRLASVRGWYQVTARAGQMCDFAIRKTEQEAREMATARLRWRMSRFT